jgi:hypothetical protein
MKYINKSIKALAMATGVLTIATVKVVIHQVPAQSRFDYPVVPSSDNPVCYMQLPDGHILNLNSLCVDKVPQEPLSTKDKQFIEEYKGFLRSYPQAQAALSRLVENNPQTIIQRAAEVCKELRTGVVSASRVAQPKIDADILNTLASEYYCREFND